MYSSHIFFLNIRNSLFWFLCILSMTLISLILLCTPVLPVMSVFAINTHLSLSHSSFACANWLLIYLYNFQHFTPLLGIFSLSPFHPVENFIRYPLNFPCLLRNISYVDVNEFSLNVSHSFSYLCMLLMKLVYISL